MEPTSFLIQSSPEGKKSVMSSTLVETVSINYEDFNESFLTCSTCLCTYDGTEHIPKLLPCSHTVCLLCLTKIVQAAQSRSSTRHDNRTENELPDSFRCPICRENIQVPRGGVGALPPSFLVNQLLDLMARQRREVVPKCGVHPSQELLFCESCDNVFCMRCTSTPHGNSQTGGSTCNLTDHTVVPFSIAIKRMSEILLYKANKVATKLGQAEENVKAELGLLERSTNAAFKSVEDAYSSLEECLRQAKLEALKSVSDLSSRKSQLLNEQLDLIKNEKNLVEIDVAGLQLQVEVRSMSDRISALQEKLEAVSSLAEPRENSYLTYHVHANKNHIEDQLRHLMCNLGRPRTSTALASLCTLSLLPEYLNNNNGNVISSTKSAHKVATNHALCGMIDTIDYHGCLKKEGGDPVRVDVETSPQSSTSCQVIDLGNGSYRFWLRPKGSMLIRAYIFDRPIKNSPLSIESVDHYEAEACVGSKGGGSNQFIQPSGVVAADIGEDTLIYVLDSGNDRIARYSSRFNLLGYLKSSAVDGRSATGLAKVAGSGLWVANWRRASVAEVSVDDGHVVRSVSFEQLKEPVDVYVNSQGQLLIADAQQSCVFVVNVVTEPVVVCRCGSAGSNPGQFQQHTLRSVTCAEDDDIVAADSTRIQVFSKQGKFLRALSPTISKGQFGGLTYDGHGFLLASYNEMARNKGSKCGIWVIRYSSGELVFNFDYSSAKMKRPGRLCSIVCDQETLVEGDADQLEAHQAAYVYVADVGDDCIKKYRYL